MASAERLPNSSRRPLGQRTWTPSILAEAPRPKCTRLSLLEIKLEPLRTSSTRVRAPAFTVILAPMPSRLDLTPIVRNAIQWFAVRASLTRREGGAFMLLTTADMRPSFHKSPTAKPREELTAVIAGPADEEISVKIPLPLL